MPACYAPVMFESVMPDRGVEGITRAARICYVLAVIVAITNALFLVMAIVDERPWRPMSLTINGAFVVVAWMTGRGIEEQRSWAKWLGYAIGMVDLINVPIGTVVGIAVIVHIHRASKAGLFAS